MTLTLNQHALDGLHLALNGNPDDFTLRLIMSDLYEEAGDELTAKAIRWQVKNKKRPLGGGWQWTWYDDSEASRVDRNSNLPKNLYSELYGGRFRFPWTLDYPTRCQAEEALWRAWARWKGLA